MFAIGQHKNLNSSGSKVNKDYRILLSDVHNVLRPLWMNVLSQVGGQLAKFQRATFVFNN